MNKTENIRTPLRRCLLVICLLIPTFAFATSPQACEQRQEARDEQRDKNFDFERFQAQLREYITREAHLTQNEACKFFPIFFEMKAKMHELQRTEDRILRNAVKSGKNDADCMRCLNEMGNLRSKQAKSEAEYMKRMRKAIGPQKLVRALAADKRFGRDRFREMFHRQPERNQPARCKKQS